MGATKIKDLKLSRAEIVALINKEAQQRYHCSGSELISRYRLGTIDPCGAAADLIALARLLPKDDPLHLAA